MIKQVPVLKFLARCGFDEKLTFQKHLQHVCNKVKSCLFGLQNIARTNYGVPLSHFASIFNGAIIPKLLYGLPVWHTALKHTGSLSKLSKFFRLSAVMSAKVASTTSNQVLYPLAGMLTPDLFMERELMNRLLNILQTTFFGPEEYANLIQPTLEFLYAILHNLIFNKYQISDNMLRDLFLNKLIIGPEVLHPAKSTYLKVTLDNSDHLKQCNPGDLIA